jgi:predicted transcriptional regulator
MLHMEPLTTAASVAANVSEQVRESGVTIVWLCGRTGIPRSTMLRRLDGHSPFNLNEIDRIANALRIPVESLLLPEPVSV